MEYLSSSFKIYILSIIAFLIFSTNYINNQQTILKSQKLYELNQNIVTPNFKLEVTNTFTSKTPKKDIETKNTSLLSQIKPDFWTTLYSIESKQGKLLYRPSNLSRNCKTTSAPCGHHQLSLQALKDISCSTKKCMADRENFNISLAMSKKLQAINDKRLKKSGFTRLPEYQEYLVHQQGAVGLKTILAASQGKKLLSKNIKKNMARNSPYSYKDLKGFGSTLAAKKFLQHWERKWQNEKKLIIASSSTAKNTEAEIKPKSKIGLPIFNYDEIKISLNLNFNRNNNFK